MPLKAKQTEILLGVHQDLFSLQRNRGRDLHNASLWSKDLQERHLDRIDEDKGTDLDFKGANFD